MSKSRTLCALPVIIFVISHIPTAGSNRIICSPGFLAYDDPKTSFPDTRCCGRPFFPKQGGYNKTEIWSDVSKNCLQLQSRVLGYPPDDACLSILPKLLKGNSAAIADTPGWADLKKRGGFFTAMNERYTRDENGPGFKLETSRFSCVALDDTSGRLVSKSCPLENLPFVCVNYGFRTEPYKHPMCPDDWLFSNHLKDAHGCIKVFPSASYNVSSRICEAEGASLIEIQDFRGIYRVLEDGYLTEIKSEAYWLKVPIIRSSPCRVRAVTAPPEVLTWKTYDCSHELAFICKIELRNKDLNISISPKEISPFLSSNDSAQTLTCNVFYNSQQLGVIFSPPFVHFRWYVDSVQLSADRPTINVIREVLSWERAGTYHCTAMLQGMTEKFTSNNVHVFPIDKSYFILNLALDPNYYQFPDYSGRDLLKALKNFYENITWTDLIEDVRKGIPGIVNARGSLKNIRTGPPHTNLKLMVQFTWESVNWMMENGAREAYLALEQLRVKLSQNPGIMATALGTANLCIAEETNSTETCVGKLYWPTSLHGQLVVSKPQCFTREGTVVNRECYIDFRFEARWGPVKGECYSLGNSTTRLHGSSKVNVTSENVIDSAETLANFTSSSENLKSENLPYIASTLGHIANTSISDPEVIRLAAVTVNNVMTINDTDLSRTQKRTNTSSRITESFERIVSDSEIKGTNLSFALDNIAVSIWQLNETEKLPIGAFATLTEVNSTVSTVYDDSDLPLDNYEAGITIPLNLVLKSRNRFNQSSKPRLSFVIYRTPNLFRDVKMGDYIKVISPVVHASIGAEPVWGLNPPAKIYFKNLKKDNASNSGKITCGYWNQRLNGNFGAWSSKGCTLEVNGDDYICHCDHLTNFGAILVLEACLDEKYHISQEYYTA